MRFARRAILSFSCRPPCSRSQVSLGVNPADVTAAQDQVKAIYEAVGRARNLKAEYGLAGNKQVKFIIDPEGTELSEADVFRQLVGANEISIEPGFEAEKGVPTALTPIGKIYLPLDGLIDLDAERDRLGRELTKAEDELKKGKREAHE